MSVGTPKCPKRILSLKLIQKCPRARNWLDAGWGFRPHRFRSYPMTTKMKFSSEHGYVTIRFSGFYKILLELRDPWYANSSHNSIEIRCNIFTRYRLEVIRTPPKVTKMKFANYHEYVDMRFSGIYKILIELRDLWYANSLQVLDTFRAKIENSAFRNLPDRRVLDSLHT